jgi:hypothetical protein
MEKANTPEYSNAEVPGTQPTYTDEKHHTDVDGHEPYDAVTANIRMGEFNTTATPHGDHHDLDLKEELLHEEVLDLYKPFPIDPEAVVEENILSIRAVLTGIILGSLVTASNLYLGT